MRDNPPSGKLCEKCGCVELRDPTVPSYCPNCLFVVAIRALSSIPRGNSDDRNEMV